MAEYLIQDTTLTEIADAVRAKTKKTDVILVSDLANEINGISGGADLNFEVVAYDTEENLLASTPTENTIGIVTDTEINGWIFSVTEPETPAGGETQVWIATGAFSPVEFNAVENNGIKVYPLSAKQYVDGAWVDKTAKSYQGGEWVDWFMYFAIDEVFTQEVHSSFATAPTMSDGKMTFNWSDTRTNASAGIVYGTGDGLNLTSINTIFVEMDSLTTTGYTWFIVSIMTSKISGADASGNFINTLAQNVVVGTQTMPINGVLSIDTSSYDGVHYVYIGSIDGYTSLPSSAFDNTKTGSISAVVRKVGYQV